MKSLTTKDTKVHQGNRSHGFLREPSCPSWFQHSRSGAM